MDPSLSLADLDSATAALSAGDWTTARAGFARALEAETTPEALEGLGLAHWWLNEVVEACRARESGYRLYVERGARRSAARLALALARDYGEFRGEDAIANGWLQRARRLLAEVPECAEHAWLRFREGDIALFGSLDPEAARVAGAEAAAIGRRVGSVDAEMLGRSLEGLALVTAGRVEEGMSRLDEAAAAVVAGEVTDLAAAADACCAMIFACERVRDFDRAAQWCAHIREVARRTTQRSLLAVCRTHYAAVLIARGDWPAAETELRTAADVLGEIYPAMLPDALGRYGELRRRQGRLDEAESLFRRAEPHPRGRIGLAQLDLDRGRPESAVDGLRTLMRQLPRADVATRAAVLEPLVEACAAAGRPDEAREVLAELERVARELGTRALRAAVDRAIGLVAEAAGDDRTATRAFEDAVHLLAGAGLPFESGVARMELARCLAQAGRREDADRQAAVARELFAAMGATHMMDRLAATLPDQEGSAAAGSRGASHGGVREAAPDGRIAPLTKREAEVLALVAEGLTNREIADRLIVSEHTIHRHVANILRKLDASSRAAAVAAAARTGFL
jgi:LuxR family transcriptional regulator, maltose regulon positive regulatory protein